MIITHDDNARSWRDLIDQPTPEQVAELEYCEREQNPPGAAAPHHHLNHARKMAEIKIARQMFADIAPPPDAVGDADEWTDWDDNVYQRMFTSWTSPDGKASVLGLQFSDQRVERFIICSRDTGNLTAEHARGLASALNEAADKLGRLA